jgi:glycerol-3-phosphate responsive antiterminator
VVSELNHALYQIIDNHASYNSLQTGQETDFILVSCTGSGIEPNRREQVLKAKKVLLFAINRLYLSNSNVH